MAHLLHEADYWRQELGVGGDSDAGDRLLGHWRFVTLGHWKSLLGMAIRIVILSGLVGICHKGCEGAHVTVIGAAATAEDSQAEVFMDLPHPCGEVFRVVVFEVVELHELCGAQDGGVGFELDQAAGDENREHPLVPQSPDCDRGMDAADRVEQWRCLCVYAL